MTEPDPKRASPGGRDAQRVTINDIARIAKVSKKTVSRVINDSPLVRAEMRDRVKAIIAEYGFSPNPQARALAFRRSFLIGIVYDNPSPQYVVHMQRGILDALEDTSFQLVLQPVDRSDPAFRGRVRSFVTQHKPFGIILPPSASEDEELVDMLRDLDCDYVRIASVMLDSPAHMVRTLDAHGAEQAATHLAGLGHRCIAHVRGPDTFRSAHERLSGFRAGLAAAGVTLADSHVLQGAYTFESGEAAAEQLLALSPRPTAVFCGNDEMAVGVFATMRRAGLSVPEDMSIVGFDDTPITSRIWPPLTTVRLPIRDMGRAAALKLIRRSEQAAETATTFSPELVVRKSTARVGG